MKVVNSETGRELHYTNATAREAVLLAYAHYTETDFSFQGYEERYGELLDEDDHHVSCGNWMALKR